MIAKVLCPVVPLHVTARHSERAFAQQSRAGGIGIRQLPLQDIEGIGAKCGGSMPYGTRRIGKARHDIGHAVLSEFVILHPAVTAGGEMGVCRQVGNIVDGTGDKTLVFEALNEVLAGLRPCPVGELVAD